MNKRLQQFLDLENLSPARLADILGVQRSGMSHILSGRNKPSYDFITKLIAKFPEIDANWFLTGKGKPYKEMNSHSSYQESSPHFQNSELAQTGSCSTLEIMGNEKKLSEKNEEVLEFGDDLFNFNGKNIQNGESSNFSANGANSQNRAYLPNNEEDAAILEQEQPRENQKFAENRTEGFKKRSIKRVIIFYTDGSFEEMYPLGRV